MNNEIEPYLALGDEEIKNEFVEAHCQLLEQWYDENGNFIDSQTPRDSRECLWDCFSLLSHGSKRYHELANKIIIKVPLDKNAFTPGAAAEVVARHSLRLNHCAKKHLKKLITKHSGNILDIRFSNTSTNNFSAKTTLLILLASQILENYEHQHELQGIPEVYNKHRLNAIGMNALRLLDYNEKSDDLFLSEWNSPTYTPITALALAGIAELVHNDEAKYIALKLEFKLWRELLSMFHSELGIPCGPYSRAYRIDILGQNSNMRLLMIYLGLHKEKSIVKCLQDRREGIYFHHDFDMPFMWAQVAWLLAGKYHLPESALEAFNTRHYPAETKAAINWEPSGFIKNNAYFPVQGNLTPGGHGYIRQVQHRCFALGYRERYLPRAHCFPAMFHYALKSPVTDLADVRSLTLMVMLYEKPQEWAVDPSGKMIDAMNFDNYGDVTISDNKCDLQFTGEYPGGYAAIPSEELSINCFLPLHFHADISVKLNGQHYAGEPIEIFGKNAVFEIEDHGFKYVVCYEFSSSVTLKLYRWCNFMRFAAFWHTGEKRHFSKKELSSFRVNGYFKLTEIVGHCDDESLQGLTLTT